MTVLRFQEVVLRRELKYTFNVSPGAGFVLRNQNVCRMSR